MGLATANTLAGISSGAARAETTLLGVGERAGNASFEEIVFIRYKKYGEMVEPPIIYDVGRRIGELLQYLIPENKPLLGKNVYIHESGIHQDGIRKDRNMYQYVCPEEFGKKADEISQPVSGISSSQVIQSKIEDAIGKKHDDVSKIIKLYRLLAKIIDKITVEEVCDLYFYGEAVGYENN